MDRDNRGMVFCQVRSSTHDKKTRTSIIIKKGKYYVSHNALQDVRKLDPCVHVEVLQQILTVENDYYRKCSW